MFIKFFGFLGFDYELGDSEEEESEEEVGEDGVV